MTKMTEYIYWLLNCHRENMANENSPDLLHNQGKSLSGMILSLFGLPSTNICL